MFLLASTVEMIDGPIKYIFNVTTGRHREDLRAHTEVDTGICRL